jgi:hypothetical protein
MKYKQKGRINKIKIRNQFLNINNNNNTIGLKIKYNMRITKIEYE